jgi:hypothetical protein
MKRKSGDLRCRLSFLKQETGMPVSGHVMVA